MSAGYIDTYIGFKGLNLLTERSITKTTGACIVWGFSFFRSRLLGNFRISWEIIVVKVWSSASLSVLTNLSQWQLLSSCEAWLAGLHLLGRALLADIPYSGWAFSMIRLSEEPSRYGIWVQRWRVRSSKWGQRRTMNFSKTFYVRWYTDFMPDVFQHN